jgi:hypothetical protein
MGRMLVRLSLIAACTALAACFGNGGVQPNTADISGAWQYTEAFTDLSHGISCADTGSYQMVQAGTTFTGTYTQRGVCRTPHGDVSNTNNGPVRAGQLTGRTLKFAAPNCSYDGSVRADAYDRIDGRVVCQLQDSTRLLNFTGSWNANR